MPSGGSPAVSSWRSPPWRRLPRGASPPSRRRGSKPCWISRAWWTSSGSASASLPRPRRRRSKRPRPGPSWTTRASWPRRPKRSSRRNGLVSRRADSHSGRGAPAVRGAHRRRPATGRRSRALSRSSCRPEEAWDYVNGLERLGMRLGLERVTKLVEALGSPHKAYRTIHVVGTNGKSSTTRFISSLLEAQGLKVGAYVSPHLISLAERQMVNSVPSTEEEFCDLVARIRPVAEELERAFPAGGVSDPVRGAYRRGLSLLQGAGLRRGRDRSRAGRPPGRHVGDLVRGAGHHQHRQGAHRASRRHALGHPQGEGGGDPAERARWWPARSIRS